MPESKHVLRFFVDRSIDGKSMAGRDKCKEFVI